MLGSVDQMQVQTVLSFADDDGFPGQRDLWVGGVGEVGHEDALPHGGALRGLHVLYVENVLGESFVENSRLNFEGNLRTFEAVFEVPQGSLGAGSDVESVEQRQLTMRPGQRARVRAENSRRPCRWRAWR